MKEKKEVKAVEPEEPKFKKQELLKAEQYRERVDLLTALLKDSQDYSLSEVGEIVSNFMKGEVK